MDMSIAERRRPLASAPFQRALTSISHIFVMEWAAVVRDIVRRPAHRRGSGCLGPRFFLAALLRVHHPVLSKIWGPLIGPIVSMLSFVCSIGNVPLAAVLWNGGISFGGVVSFLFADLIILPILVIYRKYYGTRMMLFIFGTFYLTMVLPDTSSSSSSAASA